MSIRRIVEDQLGIKRIGSLLKISGGIAVGHLISTPGNIYYCDALDGDDSLNGLSPTKAVKTIAIGEGLLTTNQHDVLVLISGTSGYSITDTLLWDKDYTHLVGMAAPTPNSRARIGNSGNSTSGNGLLDVTGDGCIMANFRLFQNSATASCHALEVSGDRNYFENVSVYGQMNTTAATGAESSSLFLNGAEEFRFLNCIIGSTTGAVANNGGVLMLDGSCGKGDFKDCKFHSYSETAGRDMINYVDTTAVDRSINFDNCEFYNFSVNHATVLNEVVDVPSSPQTHDLIFNNPSLIGIAELDTTGGAFVWVIGGTPAAGTAGSGQTGVAVHPT